MSRSVFALLFSRSSTDRTTIIKALGSSAVVDSRRGGPSLLRCMVELKKLPREIHKRRVLRDCANVQCEVLPALSTTNRLIALFLFKVPEDYDVGSTTW